MKYRVNFDPQIMGDFSAFIGNPVKTEDEARRQLEAIANYTLCLHELSLMPDYSNCGYVQIFVGTEDVWEAIDDEEWEV